MIQLVAVETFGKAYLGRILGIITLIDGLGAAYGTKLLSQLAVDSEAILCLLVWFQQSPSLQSLMFYS